MIAPGTRDGTPRSDRSAVQVTAVIVAHDGDRWLPRLLTSLDDCGVDPDRLVAVDTSSADLSRDLLTQALGPAAVISAPASTGFGAAVDLGLAELDTNTHAGPPTADGWIWLLHDDCAPAPDALEQLLAVATSAPDIAVVGPRVRSWPRARRLLEVGVTISGTGHRETGLEPGEYDQGQHDSQRDVLAVGSAGMLVRRDVWALLGGFDTRLPLFRDDVDFGWRVAKAGLRVVVAPGAVVFHAEASARGVRRIDNSARSPHRADRRAALFTLLVNCGAVALPWQYLRLGLGSTLRALGYLVGKLPSAARDEILAAASVLARPDRIIVGRLARRRTAQVSRAAVRRLLPPWWTPYANGLDSVLGRVTIGLRERAASVSVAAQRRRAGRRETAPHETGPHQTGSLRWVGSHPLLSLVAALTVAAVCATRGLHGAGLLQGGALLPAPDTAGQWWSLYAETWHPIGRGSELATSSSVAVLAMLGTLLFDKAWLVVDIALLFAPVLAAIGAFAAASRLVSSRALRVWVATSYAGVLAVSGAVTSGHLGTTVAFVLLPWVVRTATPLLEPLPEGLPEARRSVEVRRIRWRAGFATAVMLSLLVAFAPVGWPLAVTAALVAAVWICAGRGWDRLGPLTVAVLAPAVLLLPWSLRTLDEPELWLTDLGLVDPRTSALGDIWWQLPFGRLGAAGDAPWWLAVGFVLAAVVALFRSGSRARVAGAWVVIACGLGAAALLAGDVVVAPGSTLSAPAWAGFPVLLVQAAGLAAAAFAADGLRDDVSSGSFGWRQPLAAATVVVACVSTAATLMWWVVVAPQGDLERDDAVALPAYIVDAMQTEPRPRVLVIRSGSDQVGYQLLADDGLRVGDDTALPASESAALTRLVSGLVSQGRPKDVERLAELGVGYVVAPRPYDDGAVAELDALPGFTRASTDVSQLVGWQVDVPIRPTEVDPGSSRMWWLLGQGSAWLVALVLATPGLRRHNPEEVPQ